MTNNFQFIDIIDLIIICVSILQGYECICFVFFYNFICIRNIKIFFFFFVYNLQFNAFDTFIKSGILVWLHFASIVKSPRCKFFGRVYTFDVVKVMNLMISIFVEHLKLDRGQHVFFQHSVDDLDSGDSLAVETTFHLENIVLVLEVVEDCLQLVWRVDSTSAADQVFEFLEAPSSAAFGCFPLNFLLGSLLELNARSPVDFNIECSCKCLKMIIDILFVFGY